MPSFSNVCGSDVEHASGGGPIANRYNSQVQYEGFESTPYDDGLDEEDILVRLEAPMTVTVSGLLRSLSAPTGWSELVWGTAVRANVPSHGRSAHSSCPTCLDIRGMFLLIRFSKCVAETIESLEKKVRSHMCRFRRTDLVSR